MWIYRLSDFYPEFFNPISDNFEITKRYIRVRVRPPEHEEIVRYGTKIFQKKKPSIKAIWMYYLTGPLKGRTVLQALLFPKKEGWTIKEVKRWINRHIRLFR